jgi:predicted deacetylase
MSWLDSLRQTLDAAPEPVVFFFRDDDAGWADTKLFELIYAFGEYDAPLDVAVIPKAISRNTAARLRALVETCPQEISLHQHGYAHENHEPNGRKSEFGENRTDDLQLADITNGRRILFDLLGPTTDAIFTPPWNRCTTKTATCLRQTGFRYLSRDVTATQINTDGVCELPIAIDWFKQRKGIRLAPREIGDSLSVAAVGRIPVGVMLHHAIMDKQEHKRLADLLHFLSSHSQARCVLMRDVSESKARGETS